MKQRETSKNRWWVRGLFSRFIAIFCILSCFYYEWMSLKEDKSLVFSQTHLFPVWYSLDTTVSQIRPVLTEVLNWVIPSQDLRGSADIWITLPDISDNKGRTETMHTSCLEYKLQTNRRCCCAHSHMGHIFSREGPDVLCLSAQLLLKEEAILWSLGVSARHFCWHHWDSSLN